MSSGVSLLGWEVEVGREGLVSPGTWDWTWHWASRRDLSCALGVGIRAVLPDINGLFVV